MSRQSSLQISLACPGDMDELQRIYASARRFMTAHGNGNQWIDGYPSVEQTLKDIHAGHCYICRDDEGRACATFCYIEGDDPTYSQIYQGAWLREAPYGVVHRLASDGSVRGVARACFDWCFAHGLDMRVDTHADNRVMQQLFLDMGFVYCGVILCHNGTERLAYQRMNEPA